jgi:predicted N-acetyltransferase YhbS
METLRPCVLLFYAEFLLMLMILPERPKDGAAIGILLDEVFGATRHKKASYAYRVENPPVPGLSFSARCGERLVGTIRFWPISIGHSATPALLLGPLGVAPDMQNYGIGRSLILRGHMMAEEMGYKVLLLVGEEDYYSRFGYVPASPHGLVMAGEDPTRLLMHELSNDALQGASGQVQAVDCLRLGVIGPGIPYQASC